MTTRISSAGPDNGVARTTTAPRVTPPLARPFRAVMDASAAVVVSGAESAASRFPGGPILAAAVRSTPASTTVPGSPTSPEGSAGTAGGGGTALALPGGQVPGAAATAGTAGSDPTAIDPALVGGADRTLQYLELQERISAETNAYMALSNVLKARHDTIKNAIGNIR
jgi:hypothetical protein